MRLPYENYIKTLLASRKNPSAVKDELDAMGMKSEERSLIAMQEQLYLEKSEYFEDYNEPVDIDWLEYHNIDKMFGYLYEKPIRRSVEGIEGALQILEDEQIYRLITSMLLAGVDIEDIELLIQGKIDINYTLEDIKEFANYFFNLEGWNKKDKERYVSLIKDTTLKRAYNDALSGDRNKLLWKLKLSPSLDYDEMLREITYDCYYKFKELLQHDYDTALKFAGTVEKLSGRLEKISEERKSDASAQADLAFIFEEDPKDKIKTFAELKEEEED